ncbi:MAG: hypothetical protein Q4C25_08655 [Bacillota bacterium]|nr:hypothetical protein [Bacillota bacterium]
MVFAKFLFVLLLIVPLGALMIYFINRLIQEVTKAQKKKSVQTKDRAGADRMGYERQHRRVADPEAYGSRRAEPPRYEKQTSYPREPATGQASAFRGRIPERERQDASSDGQAVKKKRSKRKKRQERKNKRKDRE